MSFEAMLNHKCDVYHIRRSDATPGYGLPPSPGFSYPEIPDIEDMNCHFHVRGGSGWALAVKQDEPMAILEGRVKLALPIGADVRLNDKIVDKQNGCEYTAELPTRIRNHHIVVMLRRTDAQKPIGETDG